MAQSHRRGKFNTIPARQRPSGPSWLPSQGTVPWVTRSRRDAGESCRNPSAQTGGGAPRNGGNGLHGSEARSKCPRCWQAHAPPEGSGDVLGSFSFWWLPARPRCFLACVFTTPTPVCLHMASSLASLGLHFLLIKVTSHWTQGPPDSRRTLS